MGSKKDIQNDAYMFRDAMSRKERKKLDKQKKFEDKLIKELEKNKEKRMQKEKQDLKKLEDTIQLQQKQMTEMKRDLEKTKKISLQQVMDMDNDFIDPKPSTGLHGMSKSFLVLSILVVLGYLGFSIYNSFQQIEQVYTIIHSLLISFFALLFLITSLIVKQSAKRKMTILTALVMILFIGFHVSVQTNLLVLPKQAHIGDFSNQSITKVITWANANKVKLDYEYDYSDAIKNNKVIRQNVKPNTLAKNIKRLNVVVSEGPNYDLIINLPDMLGWHIDEVVKVIKKNKLNHVSIDFEFSEEKRDTAIGQSRSGEMKRNDELTMKFSLGREEDLQPVKMKNLIDMEEFDATLWLKRNGIKYEIKYEFSDTISKGHVISTDPKEGVTVNQKEKTVTIVISKGKKIKAPDFTKMSLEEINKWAEKNHITVQFNSEYHDKIKSGAVIRSSVNKGDSIEEGQVIYIVTSKGALKMISYNENDLNKIKTFASEHNISLNITEQFSDLPNGQIIDISVKPGDYLIEGQGIDITVSKGKAIAVPNFRGMTSTAAQTSCRNAGLNCKLNYAYSNETKNTVIYQDTNAGAEVISGATITLTISNGPKPAGSGGGSNSKPNTSGGGNSGGSTPQPPTCDTSKGGNINLQYGYTGAQTQTMIIRMNPYHKFSWNMVSACPNGDTTPGTICSSTVADGGWANYCNAIVITVVR